MSGTVGLVCTSPLIRRGLEEVFVDAGWRVVDEPSTGCDVVFVLVRTALGVAEVAETCTRVADAPIVALTDDGDLGLETDLLRAGATSVVPWGSEPVAVLATIELAAAGIGSVTSTTLATLVDRATEETSISESERMWLAELERGITIADLAPIAGYSERSLYRQLSALYHRLGVVDRHGAIAEARRRGEL